jgi:hypothetical protein
VYLCAVEPSGKLLKTVRTKDTIKGEGEGEVDVD